MHIWDSSSYNSTYTFMVIPKRDFSKLQTYLGAKGCPLILPDKEDLYVKVYDKFENERLAKESKIRINENEEALATLRYAGWHVLRLSIP